MGQKVCIHVNNLPNQQLYGQFLLSGFKKIGLDAFLSNDPDREADIHAVVGPHFALNNHIGKRLLFLDRCIWGHDLQYVTIGWVGDDGGMIYPKNAPSDRPKPFLKPIRKGDSGIFLKDYNGKLSKAFMGLPVRPHPSEKKSDTDLVEQLRNYDYAVGYRTSALATAAIEGLRVVCLDKRCPAFDVSNKDINKRQQWINNMSYAQWSGKEISTGEALEYVINSAN